MIGSGTVVKAIRQQFGQGGLQPVAVGARLAISGDGFFAVKPDAESARGRLHPQRRLLGRCRPLRRRRQGGNLQVYPVDGSGTVVATGLDSTGQPAPAADQRHAGGDHDDGRSTCRPTLNANADGADDASDLRPLRPDDLQPFDPDHGLRLDGNAHDDDELFRPRRRADAATQRPAAGALQLRRRSAADRGRDAATPAVDC